MTKGESVLHILLEGGYVAMLELYILFRIQPRFNQKEILLQRLLNDAYEPLIENMSLIRHMPLDQTVRIGIHISRYHVYHQDSPHTTIRYSDSKLICQKRLILEYLRQIATYGPLYYLDMISPSTLQRIWSPHPLKPL